MIKKAGKQRLSTSADRPTNRPIDLVEIQKISFSDVFSALKDGFKDYLSNPLLSTFFGLASAAIGIAILVCLALLNMAWLVIPLAVAFPIIAPFLAAGLYEISRRGEAGEEYSIRDIIGVIWNQKNREYGWMSFVILFIFWFWIYQVRMWLAIFLQWQSFSSIEGFVTIIVTTPEGLGFLSVGSVVGALLYTCLYSVTVMSMPMLLDREIDFVSAMLLSVQAVFQNPVVMLGWAMMIAIMVFVAMLPFFLGLVVVLPVLGHTTWHLYRRVIVAKEETV